ncbi:probable E3 ubiquitin-protein ligase RHG1A isoform X2 [Mangifera indica]|uniref:probable E3 ubiquitin-protein ligase RHG1A isoform X2 n=1 Tax=Mangifera indica TaxID=29780 RepID=UPI001CF95959|nr:probable E3 ubiquitin-protein ligase RHG1A isoform X2 [Mangifera indica]
MQGQRGTIGSFPETLSFDHGSASSSSVDQQICWNNMGNPTDNRLPDYMLSPTATNMTYVNPIDHELQTLNGWNLGEPSSSAPQNEVYHDERKTELGWPQLGSCAGSGPRLEEQQCEPTDGIMRNGTNINPNPLFAQISNSNMMPQNLNLNTGFVSHDGENHRVMGSPNLLKSGASENERIPLASGSESFLLPSGSSGYQTEETDARPGCSVEGRRASCKRKALEGHVEQSSVSGSCSYFQRSESNAWPAVSAHYDGGSSLSVPSEQLNSGLVLGVRAPTSDCVPDASVAGSAESSRRNFRVRINPSGNQESLTPLLFSTGSPVRHSSVSSMHQSSRFLPNDQSLDSRSAPVVDSASPQSQPILMHGPTLPQNLQPCRWNRGSTSRTGSPSNSNVSRYRDAFPRDEARTRSMGRNILEHPMLLPVPDLRNLVRNQANRTLAGGNLNIPGNVASSSQMGSSSGVHPSSGPSWVSHPNPLPLHYPRRFSELVRRSLISSLGPETGGHSSNQTPLRSGPPPSPDDMVISSGAVNQGYHQSYLRAASLLERQNASVIGFPQPLRSLTPSFEGRSRLVVSEIRNVLDLMRRGESLRFEDVMILDQSVFFGAADIHDRHRDMRLDVDNMSYEELLALEERIGNVSTGLSEETISNRLKQKKYSIATGPQQETEPCCICQEEYNESEDIGTLECGHDFHTICIKQWLMHKNLCPICKTTALSTS